MFNNDGVLMIDWTWVEGCWGWGACDVAVRRWYRCQWGWPDARNINWKLNWATSHVEIFYRDDTARFQQLNCWNLAVMLCIQRKKRGTSLAKPLDGLLRIWCLLCSGLHNRLTTRRFVWAWMLVCVCVSSVMNWLVQGVPMPGISSSPACNQ